MDEIGGTKSAHINVSNQLCVFCDFPCMQARFLANPSFAYWVLGTLAAVLIIMQVGRLIKHFYRLSHIDTQQILSSCMSFAALSSLHLIPRALAAALVIMQLGSKEKKLS